TALGWHRRCETRGGASAPLPTVSAQGGRVMRRAIFASLLALTGLLIAENTASAQVYYRSGYRPYYSGSYYYPSYGRTVYSTPGVTSYYMPSTGVVTSGYTTDYYAPAAGVVPSGYTTGYYAPATGVVTSSYAMPYTTGYTYPY